MPSDRSCPTCGLSLAAADAVYCTTYCARARHRYPRARLRIRELTESALASEALDRRDLAKQEWHGVGLWRARVASMHAHMAAARRAAGLPVPENWPESLD